MNELIIFNNPKFGEIRTVESGLKDTYLGVVYAVEYGDKLKIGYSTKPYTRIMVLKRNAEKYGNMALGRVCISSPHTNYREIESFLHGRFADLRIEGTELFNIKFDDFVKIFRFEKINFKDETESIRRRSQAFFNGLKGFIIGEKYE
jgi:hypothetical protein